MESVKFKACLASKAISFLQSFLIGNCFADKTGIEFYDYRNSLISYRLSYNDAILFMQYCEQYHENPMPIILRHTFKIQDQKAKKSAICHILSHLGAEEIKLIQISLFSEHLRKINSTSIDYQAIKAIQFGDIKRFNNMMALKAEIPTKTILHIIQEFIDKVKAEI